MVRRLEREEDAYDCEMILAINKLSITRVSNNENKKVACEMALQAADSQDLYENWLATVCLDTGWAFSAVQERVEDVMILLKTIWI
jgi:hypothetical protein